MFDHPYVSQQITEFERQQIERAAEQRRFLREHAGQIVPRRAGLIGRMLGRMLRHGTSGRPAPVTDAAPARRTGASVPCEPAAAR
jgi:hypothetical protein